jgi:hypothetical protein
MKTVLDKDLMDVRDLEVRTIEEIRALNELEFKHIGTVLGVDVYSSINCQPGELRVISSRQPPGQCENILAHVTRTEALYDSTYVDVWKMLEPYAVRMDPGLRYMVFPTEDMAQTLYEQVHWRVLSSLFKDRIVFPKPTDEVKRWFV